MTRGPFRSIIFDLDGVLIDSEPLYLRTINEVLRESGVSSLTLEANRAFIGKPAGYTWQTIQATYNLPHPWTYYQARYDELLVPVLERGLGLRSDAARLLKEVERVGVPRSLATSSRRKWVELKLRLLSLEGYFRSVVCGDDVTRTKPAPDIYLLAAQKASMQLRETLAIEDSPAGIVAARTAGLFTVALRTPSTEGMDLGEPDVIIDSLDEFDRGLVSGRGLYAN